jgi:hypothetical protein
MMYKDNIVLRGPPKRALSCVPGVGYPPGLLGFDWFPQPLSILHIGGVLPKIIV